MRVLLNVTRSKIASKPINKIVKKDSNRQQNRLSQKSKSFIISQIKTIINYAIEEEIINVDNPFKNIKFQNPQRQRERVLSENEIKTLLLECKKIMKTQPNVYFSVYLAVLTAGRSSTIRSIKAKDIDTKNSVISLYNFKVSRQYKLRINDEATKCLKEKVLPYYRLDEFILRANDESKQFKPFKPIFEVPPKVYRIMDEFFNKNLDKRDNYDRDKVVNFYTLRRSIITNLAKSGVSIYDVMVLLNHSNIEQTMKYLNMEHNNLYDGVNCLMADIFNDFTD